MQKRFSKILIAFCFASVLFLSSLMLSGCGTVYWSKAGKLEDMAGTYELTTYKQKDEDGNEVNRIEQLHVKAYMVVGSDGYGYYSYQDDNTDFWYDSTYIEYTRDDTETDLFKAIKVTTGRGEVKINKQKPGCGYEPTMGFNVNSKTFSYFIPDYTPQYSWIYPSYYTSVVYTKISDDTNLTKVETEMDMHLDLLPRFELKNLDGVLIFHAGMPNNEIAGDVVNEEYGKYKYYVVDFDALTGTANVYYELVEDSTPHVEEDVQLEITIVKPNEENYYQNQIIIKFFGDNYHAVLSYAKVPTMYLNYEVNTDVDEYGTSYQIYNNNFEKYRGVSETIEDIIAEQLAIYNA